MADNKCDKYHCPWCREPVVITEVHGAAKICHYCWESWYFVCTNKYADYITSDRATASDIVEVILYTNSTRLSKVLSGIS